MVFKPEGHKNQSINGKFKIYFLRQLLSHNINCVF